MITHKSTTKNQTKERQLMNTPTMSEESTATQPVKVLYTAKTHTTGGREGGASRTSDGRLDVKLSVPGAPGNGTNPEQLFAAGWSSCFLSAIKIVAAQMKVRPSSDPIVDAEVDLCSGPDGYSLRARLNVSLPGLDPQVAQAIVDGAHQTCPYSKATRGNIDVEINVINS
jgi:Ohr subfamily peroxiredoxin